MIHEAFQFLIAKKKKRGSNSELENWKKIGEKPIMMHKVCKTIDYISKSNDI